MGVSICKLSLIRCQYPKFINNSYNSTAKIKQIYNICTTLMQDVNSSKNWGSRERKYMETLRNSSSIFFTNKTALKIKLYVNAFKVLCICVKLIIQKASFFKMHSQRYNNKGVNQIIN